MSANRICLRTRWREENPPHFNAAAKQRAAAHFGRKLADRVSFRQWCTDRRAAAVLVSKTLAARAVERQGCAARRGGCLLEDIALLKDGAL